MRMNQFSEVVIKNHLKYFEEMPPESFEREAFFQSFVLLLENDTIPAQKELQSILDTEDIVLILRSMNP